MRRALVTFALVSLLLASCDGESVFDSAGTSPTPQAAPTSREHGPIGRGIGSREGERAATIPPRTEVVFNEVVGAGSELRRAIDDLKAIGVWRELTSHLYQIDLSVKSGRGNVPADRHLAGTRRFWRSPIAYGTYDYPRGIFCWVRFFPAAMEDDLFRWRSYYEQGFTGRAPPTRRQFWAGIMGHELFHCPERGGKTRPEPPRWRGNGGSSRPWPQPGSSEPAIETRPAVEFLRRQPS